MSSTSRKLCYIDGEPVWLSEEELVARRGQIGPGICSGYTEGKPGKSIGLGCHPKQAKLLNSTMKAHGIHGIEWDRKGRCTITSRRARARAMPILGQMLSLGRIFDNDGGYGDG
jgi:hypothetical protein